MLPEITIQNVVASFMFEPNLDLRRIREAFTEECFFETLTDERYTFRVVALRIKQPRFTFLIYKTGKVVCVGAKTVENAQQSHRRLLSRLQEAGINAKFKTGAKIQNIVATSTLNEEVDLEKFLTKMQKGGRRFHVIYEPEQFPAAILKVSVNQNTTATILLFSSGKLVCVGLKTFEHIRKAIRIVISKLSESE